MKTECDSFRNIADNHNGSSIIIMIKYYGVRILIIQLLLIAACASGIYLKPEAVLAADNNALSDDEFFTLSDETNLRSFGGTEVQELLVRRRGGGFSFTPRQEKQYCQIKTNKAIQWVLTDLDTGHTISSSPNAGELFFGASTSKIFVAAALLDKQKGKISKEQLILMCRMVVRSDNPAWRELQRQVGEDGSDDSGRRAIQAFTDKMGYENLRAFQGWAEQKDGSRVHGNELNSTDLAQFLYDTYHNKYPGAEILWKVMHATRTGSNKIDKYTPKSIFIAGKTGTYHGINESKKTIQLSEIKARNHATVFSYKDKHYSLTILSNTGKDEDVAVLGGGLMREYLGIDKMIRCSDD